MSNTIYKYKENIVNVAAVRKSERYRAGTGSDISDSGRARVLGFGLGLSLGFPKFGFKPVGLRNDQCKPYF